MAEASKQLLQDIQESWEKEKERYAIYLRKSRADLELEAMGEEETLARHKKILENLAAKHGISMNQITIYHELVSGDSIDERPEMQRLLDDVWEKQYKGVLVVEVERLARGNTKDQGEVAEAFQMSETKIITPVKVYDPNDEYDQEYFEFGLFMSRREYKTIKRRLQSGKQSSVEEGNYVPSKPPYGYNAVRISKRNRYLVENPEESKYVKMIFNWYTEDRKPTSWIANQLTKMGVPTIRGGEVWERSTIKDILFNAHYIGKVSWGEQLTVKEKDPVTGKIKKKRKTFHENKKLYEGKHEGFIPEEQYWKVREIYGSHAHAKINTELINPLSGIMVCKDCGTAIRFINYGDNRKSRYHHKHRTKCSKKSCVYDVLIDALIETLKISIEDFKIKMESEHSGREAEDHKEMIVSMEAELKKLKTMRQVLFASWEAQDGTYTRDEFIERKTMYAQKIERLQEYIQEEKKNAPKPVDYAETIINLHQIIDCIKNPDISAKDKNIFLKKFIDKITYDAEDLGKGKGTKPILEVFLK